MMNESELLPDEILAQAVSALRESPVPEEGLAEALSATREALTEATQMPPKHVYLGTGDTIWRKAMRHKTISLAASVTLAAGVTIFLVLMLADSGVAFAQVIERMAEVQTLHLRIHWKGKTGEAWLKRPNMLRIDFDDGTYEISNGPRCWVVNEPENSAVEKPSWYYQEAQRRGIDVTDMLMQFHLDENWSGFFSEKPVDQIRQDGKLLDVYRGEIKRVGGKRTFEALTDARTHLCHSMKLDQERDGVRTTIVQFTVMEYDQAVSDEKFVFQPERGMRVEVEEAEARTAGQDTPKPTVATGSILFGRIVWATNGKPVSKAQVTASSHADIRMPDGTVERKDFRAQAETDSGGRWRIAGVPAGLARISVRSWKYDWPSEPTFANNVGTSKHPRVLVDGKSAYSGLNFKVHKPEEFFARITINVTDEGGKPAEGAYAVIWNDDETSRVYANSAQRQQYTGWDGKFDATDIWTTEKPMRLAIHHELEYDTYATWAADLPKPFTIQPTKHYHFDVVLPWARSMQLQVTDASGRALEGVCVAAWAGKGKNRTELFPPVTAYPREFVFTDEQGRLTLTGLAPEKSFTLALMRLPEGTKDARYRLYHRRLIASAFVQVTTPKDRKPTSLKVAFDERPIRIEGTIADLAEGSSVLRVSCLPNDSEPPNFSVVDRQPQSSSFLLEGLPAGDIYIEYLLDKKSGDAHSTICRDPVNVEPGNVYSVRIIGDRLEVLGKRPSLPVAPPNDQQ